MAIASPRNFCALLDNTMAGMSFAVAMLRLGGGEAAGWSWIKKSHAAEKAGETDTTMFYLRWPSDGEYDYLHNHMVRARARRGEMLTTALLTGDVVIEDGKVVFEPGDFGEVVTFDDFGIPIAKRPALRPVRVVIPAPQRELSPESYGTVSPARKAAMAKERKPFKQMSELEKDLRAKVAEAQANMPGRITKPNSPVHILGRGGNNDPLERISTPSNQENLPTRMADAPRKQPAAIDYSRKK